MTSRSRLTRSLPGLLGLVCLAAIFGACLLSLPYTLGTGDDGGPRYAEQTRTARHLPPWWLGRLGMPGDPAARAEVQARIRATEHALGAPPRYWMGTDVLGRSLLVRVLAGGGVSLTIGLAAAMLSVFVGTVYGAVAGYVGGRTDAVMMRTVDVLYGLPYILLVVLLAVAVSAAVDQWQLERGREFSPAVNQVIGIATLFVAIGGVSWLTMARVVRGQVLSLKGQPFMEAARAMGTPVVRQFTRHLLPNLVGPITVYATLTVPQAILQESFLSFLGIGVRPPLPSWGNLAAEGLSELNPYQSRWWLLVFPCAMLGATLLALNFVGEGLREALDPKGRKR
ncbi:MAG: ABC transporter permease [Phycisphaerales bacterium]